MYLSEQRTESIADAWYETIGYGWVSLFEESLSLYSVLFNSTLKNAKMQRNWFHGFRSLNCWEWMKRGACCHSLPFRLQSCWGAI